MTTVADPLGGIPVQRPRSPGMAPSAAVLAQRARVLEEIGGSTLCTAFLATARRKPNAVALRWTRDGHAHTLTWAGYRDQVARMAAAFRRFDIGRGDRIALLTRNSVEFHIADMAALFLGATPFSIYTSSSPDQVRYALTHSRARLVIAGDSALVDTVVGASASLSTLEWIATTREPAPDSRVLALSRLMTDERADLEALAQAVSPADLATIIYTSGTTGQPKGVMLAHQNIRYAVAVYAEVMRVSMDGLRTISYLPMAHIAERQATHYFHLVHGSDVTICDDIRQLPRFLVEVRPEWWFCAPRFWEKLRSAIEADLVGDDERSRRFAEARAIGVEVFGYRSAGREIPPDLADRWARVRTETIEPALAVVGLDAAVVASSGSAAMSRETSEFFVGCGLPLSDGYGLSETSGIATWDAWEVVLGTSGRTYPGMEIVLADDGEVLIRGPLVFPGYLDDPVRTAEVLDQDGWLHTGDIGVLEGGYLRIVDRKKEILVPSSGHNVSPAMLESALKESPLIGQACAVGDARPYVTAIVVLDNELAAAWARDAGVAFADMTELAASFQIRSAVDAHVAEINGRFAPAERIRAVHIVGDEWLPDSAFLTPTAKLKRRGVVSAYADEIEAMYAAHGAA